MQGTDLCTVSQRWQSRIAASPGYVVVPNDNVFRMGMHASAIGQTAFDQYEALLRDLCREYDGTALADAIPGEEILTEEGRCYRVLTREDAGLCGPSPPDPALFRELRLVRGIGPKASAGLKTRGCRSIQGLIHHRRYEQGADHALSVLRSGPAGASALVRNRLGPSHPLGLIASEGFDPAGLRCIDLETLGIFGRPVILFGVGCPTDHGLEIHQFLLRDITEEAAALVAVADLMSDATAVVSYNGRGFDWPYLNERYAYYGMEPLPTLPHIDLLHYARRFFRGTIRDCRLSSIEEEYLRISRETDIPGMLVPEWYVRYRQTGNCGPLVPIVRHNRQDIASLVHLLTLLRKKAHDCC